MKYYYQDYAGNTVEISKSVYYRTHKEDYVRIETGTCGTGEKYRKLVVTKIGK